MEHGVVPSRLLKGIYMKQMLSDLKLPLLLMILIGLFAALSMPIMPIDETRYVSVAWEMWKGWQLFYF